MLSPMKRLLPTLALAAFLLGFVSIARADDLKAMEGKWKPESAEIGGKKIDEVAELKELLITITGDRYEVVIKDKTDRGSLKLDETKTPRQMDATDTEGDDAGKVIKAIYELKDDTLRVCYAMKGDERPTEFATKEGSPLLLITYRREK
jgi:uncharacterized protein (TIGR03067 family)